jgi:hypothetical protein
MNRRQFVRQTAFAATLYGSPLRKLGETRWLVDGDQPNAPSLDAAIIRKLASTAAGS